MKKWSNSIPDREKHKREKEEMVFKTRSPDEIPKRLGVVRAKAQKLSTGKLQ